MVSSLQPLLVSRNGTLTAQRVSARPVDQKPVETNRKKKVKRKRTCCNHHDQFWTYIDKPFPQMSLLHYQPSLTSATPKPKPTIPSCARAPAQEWQCQFHQFPKPLLQQRTEKSHPADSELPTSEEAHVRRTSSGTSPRNVTAFCQKHAQSFPLWWCVCVCVSRISHPYTNRVQFFCVKNCGVLSSSSVFIWVQITCQSLPGWKAFGHQSRPSGRSMASPRKTRRPRKSRLGRYLFFRNTTP